MPYDSGRSNARSGVRNASLITDAPAWQRPLRMYLVFMEYRHSQSGKAAVVSGLTLFSTFWCLTRAVETVRATLWTLDLRFASQGVGLSKPMFEATLLHRSLQELVRVRYSYDGPMLV